MGKVPKQELTLTYFLISTCPQLKSATSCSTALTRLISGASRDLKGASGKEASLTQSSFIRYNSVYRELLKQGLYGT